MSRSSSSTDTGNLVDSCCLSVYIPVYRYQYEYMYRYSESYYKLVDK